MPEPRKPDFPAVIQRPFTPAESAGLNAAEPETLSFLVSQYARVIWAHKWAILAFVILAGVATLFFSKRITPIYESTAEIQIDRRGPTGVVGQDANAAAQGDAEQFIATQVRLIQSASVLRPVAQQFGLLNGEVPSSNSSKLEVKGAVSLPGLKVAQVPGTYIVLISYRSESPVRAAAIANAVAKSFIEQNIRSRVTSTTDLSQFMEKQIDELRAKMERSSAAVMQYGTELDIVSPEDKTNIQASRLIQLNSDYTAAQLERVRKEAAFEAVKNGSLESAQTSGQGENARKLAEKLEEAEEKFEQVKARYGAKHPEYEKAQTDVALLRQALGNTTTNTLKRVRSEYEEAVNREEMLRKRVDQLKTQVDSQNMRSTQYQAKSREAEADRKLYEELIQKIKEAGINAGFDNNSIRMADPAQAQYQPVSPNIRNNVILALMLSLFFSAAMAILLDTTNTTVRDPESLSRSMRTEVVGILPFMKHWKTRGHVLVENGEVGTGALVSFQKGKETPFDNFDEAMRSLRNTILLSSSGGTVKKLLFTGASPGEGKTTSAVHVAVAHALQGYKTLLIDADLRRPGTKEILQYVSSGGISDIVRKKTYWRNELASIPALPNLDILPAGIPDSYAAATLEKLMPEILREAAEDYSLIVIDAPPLLGFSEPLHLATLVDGVVIVARAGQTNRKDVATLLHTLRRLRAPVAGIVLNGVTKEMASRYHFSPGNYEDYYGHYYSGKNGSIANCMKVVFLNATGQLGGAEKAMICLLQALRKARPGWELEVVAADDGPLVPYLGKLGFAISVLPLPESVSKVGEAAAGNPLKLVKALFGAIGYRSRLSALLKDRDPAIVHTMNFKMHLLGAAALGSGSRWKLCWHMQDFVSGRALTSRLLRLVSRKAHAVLALSESVARDMRQVSKAPERVYTVLNAVDLEHFRPEGPVADLRGKPGIEATIGLIATFAHWKGHDVFLRALSALPSSVDAYIAGGGVYKTAGSQLTEGEIRSRAEELGVADRVTFTGFLEDTAPLMRGLDVVVHASTKPEPFGMAIAEAMACGRAVVASMAGGAAEILKPGVNGLGHSPGDVAGLTESIRTLTEQPRLRKQYGDAARAAAEALFDPARMARQTIEIYESCLR